MFTAATLHKAKLFDTPEKLDYLERELLDSLQSDGWKMQAWAVFPNHYHFVAIAPENPDVTSTIRRLHGRTARQFHLMDGVTGRKVWFQFYDSALTYQSSYFARLSYVHRNAVRHGIVREPRDYRWCSARWFSEQATRAQYESLMELPIDKVNVVDDF